jgi:hypothetical protein
MKIYSNYIVVFLLFMMFGFTTQSTTVGNSDKCTYKSFDDSSYTISDKLLVPKIPLIFSQPYFEQQIISDSLQVVVNFLKNHPDFQIELRSHTDYRDSDSNNYTLSQRNAREYCDYLISKGIATKRVIPVGMGESEPFIIDNCFHSKYPQFEIGDTLNESLIMSLNDRKERETAHAINRRNEIVIVGI